MEMERTRDGQLAAATVVAMVLNNDDLLVEILLRVDFPSCLVHAALVCRRWLRLASDPVFLRRFRALHPPRILALSLVKPGWFPVPQPRELAVAASRALATLHRSNVCDCRNDSLLVAVISDDDRRITYAIRSLLRLTPDIPLPMPPSPGLITRNLLHRRCNDECRLLLFLEGEGDAASIVCLDMEFNSVQCCAQFSILQSGVWGVQRYVVTEHRQSLLETMMLHKLLVGRRLYMMTTLGYILVLDLDTASFSNVQLPVEVRYSRTLRFSRAQQSGLYLIDVTGFQLRVWHGDGAGQWVLVDSFSVREACANLDVRRWKPDDGRTAPVWFIDVSDNAEFVIFELVASKVICCMQLSNKAVEKVVDDRVLLSPFDFPIAMVWPPIFPVLEETNQEN